ncbi:hypothetical protein [Microvirga pudoricolor]|jgi:hypothetical protein|uniref:hypothetical protein n=1 Tax=Microvirga pudoricolor TaxID=2778729 RepID=UPI00194FC63C|nr:hypothetical protein [Microvirga pudoricolor]MBM6595594.1 hypothetical protein [Microvirga pudoricolor]
MRAGMIAITLALLVSSPLAAQPASVKDRAASGKEAVPARQLTEAESRALGDEARRKSDAQQRAWDAKTRGITRGICNGC